MDLEFETVVELELEMEEAQSPANAGHNSPTPETRLAATLPKTSTFCP
jgi:hypothetical protein